MRVVFYLFWMLLLTIFQPTLARGIALWGIAPNLFLCFVVMIGFFRGTTEGAICGAIFGLAYDILVGRMIGVSGLIYLYLGVGAGILGTRFFSGEKQLANFLGTIAASLVAGLVYYLARKAVGAHMGFGTAMFRIGLIEAIYNGVVGFLLAKPVRLSMKLLGIKQIS